jgi:hypothetical protein
MLIPMATITVMAATTGANVFILRGCGTDPAISIGEVLLRVCGWHRHSPAGNMYGR